MQAGGRNALLGLILGLLVAMVLGAVRRPVPEISEAWRKELRKTVIDFGGGGGTNYNFETNYDFAITLGTNVAHKERLLATVEAGTNIWVTAEEIPHRGTNYIVSTRPEYDFDVTVIKTVQGSGGTNIWTYQIHTNTIGVIRCWVAGWSGTNFITGGFECGYASPAGVHDVKYGPSGSYVHHAIEGMDYGNLSVGLENTNYFAVSFGTAFTEATTWTFHVWGYVDEFARTY